MPAFKGGRDVAVGSWGTGCMDCARFLLPYLLLTNSLNLPPTSPFPLFFLSLPPAPFSFHSFLFLFPSRFFSLFFFSFFFLHPLEERQPVLEAHWKEKERKERRGGG